MLKGRGLGPLLCRGQIRTEEGPGYASRSVALALYPGPPPGSLPPSRRRGRSVRSRGLWPCQPDWEGATTSPAETRVALPAGGAGLKEDQGRMGPAQPTVWGEQQPGGPEVSTPRVGHRVQVERAKLKNKKLEREWTTSEGHLSSPDPRGP